MENNEQNNMEPQKTETPKKKANKPKVTKRNVRKKTGTEENEERKKTIRKPRTSPTKNSVQPTEVNTPITETQETSEEKTIIPEVSVETEATETAETQQPTDAHAEATVEKPKQTIPPLPNIRINNIVELLQAPMRSIVLTDQQIQQLTLEEIERRHRFLEETLSNVLDYDIVISDTNIWLELLIGYTSSHSDPRYNARLQFERQLEFISKLVHYRGGRFMILGETYEEIDRFATMLDPTDHRDADFTDNIVCLNTAARLAKRLILAQQRENRLRICGIGAESHHASFADPAIIRKVAELFAMGKKVLLMTNDASVAIRAMGICDDLQRYNNISDEDWDENYAPLRPMVFTFDDLKQLDFYTRQYHYIQMAAGTPWMADIEKTVIRHRPAPLELSQEAFRPGDKHRGDNLFNEQEMQQAQQKLQQAQQMKKQPNKQQNNQQTVKQPASKVQKQQKTDLLPVPMMQDQVLPVTLPAVAQEQSPVSNNEQKTKLHSRRKQQQRNKNVTNKGTE